MSENWNYLISGEISLGLSVWTDMKWWRAALLYNHRMPLLVLAWDKLPFNKVWGTFSDDVWHWNKLDFVFLEYCWLKWFLFSRSKVLIDLLLIIDLISSYDILNAGMKLHKLKFQMLMKMLYGTLLGILLDIFCAGEFSLLNDKDYRIWMCFISNSNCNKEEIEY